jgi:hypothetical protein
MILMITYAVVVSDEVQALVRVELLTWIELVSVLRSRTVQRRIARGAVEVPLHTVDVPLEQADGRLIVDHLSCGSAEIPGFPVFVFTVTVEYSVRIAWCRSS